MTALTSPWSSATAASRTLCSYCLDDIKPGAEVYVLALRRLTFRKGPRKGQQRTFCARCATDDLARALAGAAA
jgi:hypothetical protein